MRTTGLMMSSLLLAATLLLGAGCGDQAGNGKRGDGTAPGKTPDGAPKGVVVSADKAAITGTVRFEGTPPKPKTINFGPEKQCAAMHEHGPPPVETLMVNPNGTLKWTLVHIRDKVAGDFKPSTEPVVIDQVGCVFVPHGVALMAGQELEFRNSDPLLHNVRGMPTRSLGFNFNFPAKADGKTRLTVPEIGIPIKCDVHFWMSAYIHVLPHPFFAITQDDGSFVINGVPPGSYTLQAWHETLKTQTQEITVAGGEVKKVEFVYMSK